MIDRQELFPIFNLQGVFLRNVNRQELYEGNTQDTYYRIVHNIVYLPDGRIWVQKRAKEKHWGGYLVSTASGHLEAGETPKQAMLREVREELFNHTPIKWRVKKLGRDLFFKPDEGRTQRISVFVSESDGSNFSPLPKEIDEIYPMSVEELKILAEDPNSLLVPDFRYILQKKF